MSDETGREVVTRQHDSSQMELWAEFRAVEQERMASADRRTEVLREGIALAHETQRQQLEFHKDRIRRDDEHRGRRWASRTKMAWVGIVAGLAVFAVLLWAVFFGDEGQQDAAVLLLSYALSGGAFFGLGYYLGHRSPS
ncbi:hypothetical protein [Candidatus Palauibacter sp.]|uniref:hypothetical protein n=1 Tax=Candidatus Palauibacter sp. TaxID=3101350 RepID=UPI003B01221C